MRALIDHDHVTSAFCFFSCPCRATYVGVQRYAQGLVVEYAVVYVYVYVSTDRVPSGYDAKMLWIQVRCILAGGLVDGGMETHANPRPVSLALTRGLCQVLAGVVYLPMIAQERERRMYPTRTARACAISPLFCFCGKGRAMYIIG